MRRIALLLLLALSLPAAASDLQPIPAGIAPRPPAALGLPASGHLPRPAGAPGSPAGHAEPTPRPGARAGQELQTVSWYTSSGTWQWSPAAPHHAAVVQVITPAGGGASSHGSGCYVEHGGIRGILTAAHCVANTESTVVWSDGSRTTGSSLVDQTRADVAWIQTENSSIQPLQFAAADPPPGTQVELAGFGGPANQLRHWWGTTTGQQLGADTEYRAAVLQGDSGGPILDTSARVVGVISWGSGQPIASVGTAQAFRSTGGPRCGVIRAFIGRVAQRFGGCGPSGCPPAPSPRYPSPGSGGSPGWAYPPRPTPPIPAPSPAPNSPIQKPDLQPPVPAPVQPPAPPEIDYDRLAATLVPLLAADERFRGPAGPMGPAGVEGCPGPPGMPGPAGASGQPADVAAIADAVIARLPPIHVQNYDRAGRLIDEERYPYPGPIKLRHGAVDRDR